MTPGSLAGHFIDGSKGRIFVLTRMPVRPRGCVLVVPPFAEEMNKSRRMVTEVSLGLAERGIGTVFPDLYGTGDSEGDFADARWPDWLEDLAAVARWASARGFAIDRLLGVRLGCALGAQVVARGSFNLLSRTVLWQPVFDGGRFLTQFLRLRTAASLMEDRKETVADLRGQLTQGRVVEVAGYGLSGPLARDLDALNAPDRLPVGMGDTAWMEAVREAGDELSLPSQRLIEQCRAAGLDVQVATFAGEPFWASTEIVRNQQLIAATVQHLAMGVAHHG